LAQADIATGIVHGGATKENLRREYEVFGDVRYENISNISVSHLYNLRQTYTYKKIVKPYITTPRASVSIGERRKPRPDGVPGYFRIDTVHQGDLDDHKGVYHVNIVDEVIQLEYIACCKTIDWDGMKEVFSDLFNQIPIEIQGFHSDNGSEYINKQVAKMLNRLNIQFTKSRSRRSNDQALVEFKNGSVIRKHMGHSHIPKINAYSIDQFYKNIFNPYLNFHRVCAYPEIMVLDNGKVIKKYKTFTTPYERLKTTPEAFKNLRDGLTFEILDKIAYAQSDIEAATNMQKEKLKLFKSFRYPNRVPTK